MACQKQNIRTFKDREPARIENQSLLLMLRVNGLPLSQIKNEPCWKQKEKGNIASGTSLFSVVRSIFRLNHARSEENILSYVTNGKAEASDVIANRTATEIAGALVRRAHIVQ